MQLLTELFFDFTPFRCCRNNIVMLVVLYFLSFAVVLYVVKWNRSKTIRQSAFCWMFAFQQCLLFNSNYKNWLTWFRLKDMYIIYKSNRTFSNWLYNICFYVCSILSVSGAIFIFFDFVEIIKLSDLWKMIIKGGIFFSTFIIIVLFGDVFNTDIDKKIWKLIQVGHAFCALDLERPAGQTHEGLGSVIN